MSLSGFVQCRKQSEIPFPNHFAQILNLKGQACHPNQLAVALGDLSKKTGGTR
jgi:hypothetical protein